MRRLPLNIAALLLAAASLAPPLARGATVDASGDAVVFDGRIDARSAQQFLQLLQDPAIRRLVITSRGGLVDAALDMAEAIAVRELDVEVPTVCLSSCANYIFPAGRRKSLGWPGAVAWHGNMTHIVWLDQTGHGAWTREEMDDARRLARREARFYARIGVDGFACWFGKIAPYDVEDFYRLSVADMERFGIGDVTVHDEVPPGTPASELRTLDVDWSTLDAIRPVVTLDP